VHELRAFIEKGRVVFIAFQNERPALAQMEAGLEILRDTTNQE